MFGFYPRLSKRGADALDEVLDKQTGSFVGRPGPTALCTSLMVIGVLGVFVGFGSLADPYGPWVLLGGIAVFALGLLIAVLQAIWDIRKGR